MVVILCGCDRHVHVTKEMKWECVPTEQSSTSVILRYLEDPQYFDVVASPDLCRQLQASGIATAKVTYDVWGNFVQTLHGYRIEWINGQAVHSSGGSSGHDGTGSNKPHPLTTA